MQEDEDAGRYVQCTVHNESDINHNSARSTRMK